MPWFCKSRVATSWPLRVWRKFATRIDPEIYAQDQGGPAMTRYGVVKAVGGKFAEIEGGGNQFMIERPSGGSVIDAGKALDNNRGFVYAAVNAEVPDGRYKSLAITALKESAMWANKGVTRESDGTPRPGAVV